MKLKNDILFIGLFLLTSSFKIGYDWAQASVDNTVISKTDLPKSALRQIKQPALTLVLMTKKHLIITPSNGNTYLRCYLINNTDSTSIIERADATITGFSTEILKDKVWQHFQHPISSRCGNSYWKQNLAKNKILSIKIDHVENGPIKVPFRIKYNHNNRVIYSNEITVDIDQKNYDRVGKQSK